MRNGDQLPVRRFQAAELGQGYSPNTMKLELNLYRVAVYILKRLAHKKNDIDRILISESGLFDEDFYRAAHPDIRDEEDPLLHFIIAGANEGRRPNAHFDTRFYADSIRNDREWKINPLVHYLLVGRGQGRPVEDPRDTGPESAEAVIRASGLFDEGYYRAEYPDVAGLDDVVAHYVFYGAREGRKPNADFDPKFYARIYQDVAESGLQPFVHYLKIGRAEQRLTKATGEGGAPSDARVSGGYRPGTATPYFEEARPVSAPPKIDALAFYLPQFHPFPQNDAWWGKGFTEWTNVTKAEQMFTGHLQPRLPGDLGFYDLRLPEVMEEQAKLARRFGLSGFCFHYYWFDGTRLLDRPLENWLARPDFDLPFCLCWANENWTRRWDGQESEILIAQNHSAQDDLAMIADVARYMRDPRYYRVAGKPLFVVYRPDILPEPAVTIERWRTYCRDNGIGEVVVAAALTFGLQDPAPLGFDIAVEFPPHGYSVPKNAFGDTDAASYGFEGLVIDYRGYVKNAVEMRFGTDLDVVRTIIPGWDNTARRGARGTVYVNAWPDRYQTALSEIAARAEPVLGDRPLVMVNAWNEWAEGAYLEPDRAFGHAFLNATARALSGKTHGRLLLPEGMLRDVDFPGTEVSRYVIGEGATALHALVMLGREVLDYDMVLLPGGEAAPAAGERIAGAVALLHENPLIGAVSFGAEAASPFEADQALLVEWGHLVGLPVSGDLALGPRFGDPTLVRTGALRPMLKAARAFATNWIADAQRRQFLDACLGTLCESQGYAVVRDAGES